MNPFLGQQSGPNPDGQRAYENWMETSAPKVLSGDMPRPQQSWDLAIQQGLFKDYLKIQSDLAAARGDAALWQGWEPYRKEILTLEREKAQLQGTLEARSVPSSGLSSNQTKIILGVLSLAGTLLVAWWAHKKGIY
jgi:hypothetical protein